MQLQIVIQMDNAAFDESPTFETARILRKLAVDIVQEGFLGVDIMREGFLCVEGENETYLYDANGNATGTATLTED